MSHRLTALAIVAAFAAVSCTTPAPPVMTTSAPSLPRLVSPPVERVPTPPPGGLITPVDPASEELVGLDTHGREIDVRQILDFLGGRAGVRFVYSPDINKRIRVTLVDVPVSQAIQTVLATAGLTLEAGATTKTPPTPGVVFYALPVNIDSLSVDAIMRRFGVGRAVAEMLVESRAGKP
jgi:hypothetical protein